MTRIVVVVALVLSLLVTLCGQVLAQAITDQESKQASFSVSKVLNMTIADAGTAGLNFGNITPDSATLKADEGQTSSTTPALVISIGSESNVRCDVKIWGTAFSGPAGSTPVEVGSLKYSTTYETTGAKITTGSEASLATDIAPGGSVDVFHWVNNVPAGTVGGTYTATVYYKAVERLP